MGGRFLLKVFSYFNFGLLIIEISMVNFQLVFSKAKVILSYYFSTVLYLIINFGFDFSQNLFNRISIFLVLSNPPKPHPFLDLPNLCGGWDDSDEEKPESESDEEEYSDEEEESEEDKTRSKQRVEYEHNEEDITTLCKNTIYSVQESTGDKRIEAIIDKAFKEEEELDRKVENLEKKGVDINDQFKDLSDEACYI
jgi:hypothetical protein